VRVVIAGGGTGGHLYPGLALAEELKIRDPQADIVFMGTVHGIEARVVPREGYTIKFIPAEGFVGVSIGRKVRSLYRFFQALKVSYSFLQEFRPEIVVGSGGYASLAPLTAAWMLTIPTMLLEQNTVAGKANRLLGYVVKSVCITYQDSMAYFPREKVHLTGNPVRERILRGSRPSALRLFSLGDDLFTVFVFGGSAGAESINTAMMDALQYLLDLREEVQFLHQTGERDFETVRDAYRSYGYTAMVTPFIYQMPEAYAVADLVVSRAGATTLAEITVTGKPSILVPYPYAAANHQEVNAGKLERLGAAVMVRNVELNGKRLSAEIRRLYNDPALREHMGTKAMGLGRPDAVKRIADIALSLISLERSREGCLNSSE